MVKKSKQEKARQKAGKIISKYRRYTYASFVLKFEYRAFGYCYTGSDRQVVDDGYSATDHGDYVTVKHNTHIVKYVNFDRTKAFQKNFLFNLFAFFNFFVSHIRTWVISLLPLVVILGIIGIACNMSVLTVLAIAVPLGLIALSYFNGAMAILWRKVFKLDERTNAKLNELGWESWDDYVARNDPKYN